jgi:NADH dehydrogenase
LSEKARQQLVEIGVEVQTGKHVTDIQPGYVVVDGDKLDAVVTLWAAGVQASPLGKMLGAETDKRGAVIVDEFLNPAGMPHVFVCGDLAHFMQDGKQVPGVAQPAMQMGKHAAAEIAADLQGKQRRPFRYFDKGDMATIGRKAAVARIVWPFKANWSGVPAWATWLAVHIFFLIGFRNRVAVFSQWAWTYFTFNRGARLITGSTISPGWGELLAEESPKQEALAAGK